MPKTLAYILFSLIMLAALAFVIYMGTRKVILDDNHFVEIVFIHDESQDLGTYKRSFGYRYSVFNVLSLILPLAIAIWFIYSLYFVQIKFDVAEFIAMIIFVLWTIFTLLTMITTKVELYENGLVYHELFTKKVCIFSKIDKLSPFVVINQFHRIKAYGFRVVLNGQIAFNIDGRTINDMDLLVATILSDDTRIQSVTKITGKI